VLFRSLDLVDGMECIEKPFSPSDLLDRVQALLDA
jgi:DNA-binding response OmpR family regulator